MTTSDYDRLGFETLSYEQEQVVEASNQIIFLFQMLKSARVEQRYAEDQLAKRTIAHQDALIAFRHGWDEWQAAVKGEKHDRTTI
jgi:hypothetical protein